DVVAAIGRRGGGHRRVRQGGEERQEHQDRRDAHGEPRDVGTVMHHPSIAWFRGTTQVTLSSSASPGQLTIHWQRRRRGGPILRQAQDEVDWVGDATKTVPSC